MLAEFRTCYPQGSLVSELIDIDRGLYLVKVAILVEGITLATGLAGMDKIELAEDRARERALSALALEVNPTAHPSTAREKIATSSPPSPKLEEPVLATVTNHPDNSDNKNTTSNPSAEDTAVVPNFVPTATSLAPETKTTQTTITSASSTVEDEPSIAVAEQSKSPGISSKLATSFSEPTDLDDQEPDRAATVTSDLNQGTLFAPTDNLSSATEIETLSNLSDATEKPLPKTTDETDAAQAEVIEMDFNQIKHQTDIEIKRLGWTRDDGRNFLQSHYGKRSRLHLTDEELLEFLHYLESLPTSASS